MSKISALLNYNTDKKIASCGNNQEVRKLDSPYYYDPKRAENYELKESTLLPNNLKTKWKIANHKILNTLTVYPAKGFTGDKNSNFYEFLTMGMFPYVAGSLTFMALFNGATRFFEQRNAAEARKVGYGFALGVLFYGLAKELSKKLISIPVAMKTGIDMDMPYRKVVNLIPRSPDQSENHLHLRKEDNTAFEYHKAFESVDFPRIDLLYKHGKKHRNDYYDMIAQKNGFGTNLNDSDQEVKPFIKEVVTKARTAQNISQYLWAATGVALGAQQPWQELATLRNRTANMSFGKKVLAYARTFGSSFKDSCKSFFNGGVEDAINPKAKIAGRVILGAAVLSTVLGVINAVRNPYMKNDKNMSNTKIFADDKKVKED